MLEYPGMQPTQPKAFLSGAMSFLLASARILTKKKKRKEKKRKNIS